MKKKNIEKTAIISVQTVERPKIFLMVDNAVSVFFFFFVAGAVQRKYLGSPTRN